MVAGAFVLWVVSDVVGVWWLRWDVGFVAPLVGLAGLPIALGIAIMRYRLHDIDIIINRTLVYGTLTAVMAGIFEVSVVTLQHVLLVLTHAEDSQLAYFVTAMVIAAHFEPIKRRIDAFVERQLLRGDQVGERTSYFLELRQHDLRRKNLPLTRVNNGVAAGVLESPPTTRESDTRSIRRSLRAVLGADGY